MSTPLSPAAQAVLDAVASQMEGGSISPDFIPYEAKKIAAALRAVADQVVPREDPPAYFLDHPVAAEIEQRQSTRAELLAIAAELEGQP